MEPAPAAANAKRKRGNQDYETNEQHRNLVRLLVAGGITYDRIAAAIDISESTLKRHYRQEIKVGQTEIDLLAVSALVRAMRGTGKEAVIAAKWWNQARMGWSEKITIDDPGANVPMRVEIELVGSADGAATPTHRDTGPRLPAGVLANIDLKG